MADKQITTWSYSGRPGSSNKDTVRFLIGDTNPKDKLLDDCEIEYLISSEGTPERAAICAAETIAAMFSRDFDGKSNRTTSSKIAEQYHKLSKRLRAKYAHRPFVPFVGGLKNSDKKTHEADGSTVSPFFDRDLHDSVDDSVDNTPRRCE